MSGADVHGRSRGGQALWFLRPGTVRTEEPYPREGSGLGSGEFYFKYPLAPFASFLTYVRLTLVADNNSSAGSSESELGQFAVLLATSPVSPTMDFSLAHWGRASAGISYTWQH